jgi:hypothetical protein
MQESTAIHSTNRDQRVFVRTRPRKGTASAVPQITLPSPALAAEVTSVRFVCVRMAVSTVLSMVSDDSGVSTI